ncbi:MAG: IS66 family transposase [Acidobacteria bacterium]|nr:IS66 family transposase [Acidobacteriota bacterium]
MCGERVPRLIPAELDAELTPAVRAFVETLLSEIDALRTEVSRLKKTPQNSSLPPSSQHPHAKPPAKKPKSKKKRGGQPGHKKHERPLIPTDQCDDVETLKPTECRRCGVKLRGSDPAPLRHQVWELPPIKPHVTEYRRHRLRCSSCGETTCAELPAGVPTGQAGPRLVALAALLMGCFRQSKSRTALFLSTILRQPCSTGWVVKLQNQATAALRPAYDELVAQLPRQPTLAIDETPTKEGAHKSWLWTYVAKRFTLFAVRPSRGASGVTDLLGPSFEGVVHCDRARMYLALERLQWCWAHLKRDFQALVDDGRGKVKRLGHDLLRPTRELFRLWARYRDGTLSPLGWKRAMTPIRKEIEALLLRGAFSGERRLTGMCEELYDRRDWLWTFLHVEGVQPTNNASERALRHAVIWRKLSFGTQSAQGSRFVETMLTVVETCRQQQRPVFDYLAQAVKARCAGQNIPSLVPRE